MPLLILCISTLSPRAGLAQPLGTPPAWDELEGTVRRYFSDQERAKRGALIVQSDVERVLQQFASLGWEPQDQQEILEAVLPDNDYLVQQLASSPGRKFMARLTDEKLIYDQLDRLVRERGGKQLVHDLIRLPDGYRYAEQERPRGVPGMVEFLPKTKAGKSPQVKDYDKPTGRIYTAKDLISRLQASYDEQTGSGEAGVNPDRK